MKLYEYMNQIIDHVKVLVELLVLDQFSGEQTSEFEAVMYSIHRKFIVSQGQSLLKILHLAINFFLRKNAKKRPCVWAKNGHDTLL